jgi:hypothetical protein
LKGYEVTNPYAPPNNERNEFTPEYMDMLVKKFRVKWWLQDMKCYVTGALLMLILLMVTISITKEITINQVYYLAVSLLGVSFAIDMYIIWIDYRKK